MQEEEATLVHYDLPVLALSVIPVLLLGLQEVLILPTQEEEEVAVVL